MTLTMRPWINGANSDKNSGRTLNSSFSQTVTGMFKNFLDESAAQSSGISAPFQVSWLFLSCWTLSSSLHWGGSVGGENIASDKKIISYTLHRGESSGHKHVHCWVSACLISAELAQRRRFPLPAVSLFLFKVINQLV